MDKLRLLDVNAAEMVYADHMVQDFPEDELKPFRMIRDGMLGGWYDMLAMTDERGELLAYAGIYRKGEGRTYLLDYLAVTLEQRGRGGGTRMLHALRDFYSGSADSFVIECETPEYAPNPETAERRICFYTTAGALRTAVRFLVFGVDYTMLILPVDDQIIDADWADVCLSIYRNMVPEELYRRNINLLSRNG